jgi:hypothetical protein
MPARNACNNSGADERKTCNPRPLRHSDIILDIYTDSTESSFKQHEGAYVCYSPVTIFIGKKKKEKKHYANEISINAWML